MRIILILFLIFNISFAKCMENEPQEKFDPFEVKDYCAFLKFDETYACGIFIDFEVVKNGLLDKVNPFHLKDPAINYYRAFMTRPDFVELLNVLSIRNFKEAFNNDVLYKHYNKEIVNAYYQYRLSTYRQIINRYFTERDYAIVPDIGYSHSWIFRSWLFLPPIYLDKKDFLSIIYTAAQRKYRFFFPYLSLQELIFLNFIRLKPQEKINNYETIKLPNQSGFIVSQYDISELWDDVRHIPRGYCMRLLEHRKRILERHRFPFSF